jgi:ribonuclease HI
MTNQHNFLQHNTDNIIVYTDGSKGQSLGSAFVIYYKGNILCEHKFSIGSRAQVFDDEVAAITNAIHYLAQHPLLAHNIYIFSDNSSAISTLAQADSGLILRHRQLLQPSIDFLRNQNRQIVLNWVPSHCNIAGNESAESLAKSAASTPDSPQHPATPSYLKRILKQTRQKLWQKAFENRTSGAVHHGNPSLKSAPTCHWNRHTSRALLHFRCVYKLPDCSWITGLKNFSQSSCSAFQIAQVINSFLFESNTWRCCCPSSLSILKLNRNTQNTVHCRQ